MSVRIVVFDLGGVVVRICRSIKEAGERAGVAIPAHVLTPEGRAARKALHAEYERGRMVCEDFFEAIARTIGGGTTGADVRRIHEAWLIDEYTGVGALVADIHRAGIETGVLSNTNPSHWAQMHRAGTGQPGFPSLRTLRHRHASHLLGAAKPDAAIFAAFEAKSGFRGSEIVFFDDLTENVAAAVAAGWHSHVIDHTAEPAAQMRTLLREHHGFELGKGC